MPVDCLYEKTHDAVSAERRHRFSVAICERMLVNWHCTIMLLYHIAFCLASDCFDA